MPNQTTILALLSRKGGSGRTTLAFNIAGEFSRRKVKRQPSKVLLIDLDGQASLSRAILGSPAVDQLDPDTTTAPLLAGLKPYPDEIIHQTDIAGVCLAPACNTVERFCTPPPHDKPHILRDFLNQLDDFTHIIIDTSPNTLTFPTHLALAASTHVLSPVTPTSFGCQSIASITRVLANLTPPNPGLQFIGFCINQTQRNRLHIDYIETLRQTHGDLVLQTEIPLAVAYAESIVAAQPITLYKPGKPAQAIKRLTDEIQDRITKQQRAAA